MTPGRRKARRRASYRPIRYGWAEVGVRAPTPQWSPEGPSARADSTELFLAATPRVEAP